MYAEEAAPGGSRRMSKRCMFVPARMGLYVVERAVVLQRELQGAQCHVALKQEGGVLRREHIGALPHAVQFYDLCLIGPRQSVGGAYHAAVELHDVRLRQAVVVVVVFLARREHHGHRSASHEDRVAQGVAAVTPQRDGVACAGVVARDVLADAVEAVLRALELPDVQRGLRVVDA